ncbi:MAG: hypothetical protein AB4352_10150 [Hormoscilla sp.]
MQKYVVGWVRDLNPTSGMWSKPVGSYLACEWWAVPTTNAFSIARSTLVIISPQKDDVAILIGE